MTTASIHTMGVLRNDAPRLMSTDLLLRAVRDGVGAFRRALKDRRDLLDLWLLDDRMLADIGLRRDELPALLNVPMHA